MILQFCVLHMMGFHGQQFLRFFSNNFRLNNPHLLRCGIVQISEFYLAELLLWVTNNTEHSAKFIAD